MLRNRATVLLALNFFTSHGVYALQDAGEDPSSSPLGEGPDVVRGINESIYGNLVDWLGLGLIIWIAIIGLVFVAQLANQSLREEARLTKFLESSTKILSSLMQTSIVFLIMYWTVGLFDVLTRREAVLEEINFSLDRLRAEYTATSTNMAVSTNNFSISIGSKNLGSADDAANVIAIAEERLEIMHGLLTAIESKNENFKSREQELLKFRHRTYTIISFGEDEDDGVEYIMCQLTDARDCSFGGPFFNLLKLFRSETLTIALLIVSGTLGAIFAKIRDGEFLSARTIGLGASVGFIFYLAIRGGESITVVANSSELLGKINPHGAAALALLGGLFADLVYRHLNGIVGETFNVLSARVQATIKGMMPDSENDHTKP